MAPAAIQQWHKIMEERRPELLSELLADDVTFISPVVHTPQEGKDITMAYLSAAQQTLGNDSFKYLREVYNDNFAVLEFETEIDGILINGIDMITWDDNNQISEFKVMVRPLKAINTVHKAMGEALMKLAGQ